MKNRKFLTFARTSIKNLFRKPATVGYPYQPADYPERMRGHVEIKTDNCILCGLCMRSCPPGAIRIDRADATWTINRFDCVQCGSCVNACPKECLTLLPGYTQPASSKTEDVYQCPKRPTPAPPKRPA